MRITSNVYLVGGGELSSPQDAAIYLVKSGDAAALIDAGTGAATRDVISNIKSVNVSLEQVAYIFLTHCHFDHTGGAAELCDLTGAEIIMHDLDAVYVETGDSDVTAAAWYGTFMKPFEVNIKVTEKQSQFTVGEHKLNFLHAPGHSPGSSVVTLKSDGKLVLFGQDIHGPLNETLLSNRNDYNTSLEYLMSLGADILCEGHFGIVHGKDKVSKFIESYM